MTTSPRFPVLPLRDLVLFPGVTAPVSAGRPATLRALEKALQGDRTIFVVAQRQAGRKVSPADLHTIGTLARVDQAHRGLAGMQVLLTGSKRGVAMRYLEEDGFLEAIVRDAEEQPPIDESDPGFAALYRELRQRAEELGERAGVPAEVVRQVMESIDDPGRTADLVAGYTEIAAEERQHLLETLSVEERMRRVLVHVQRHLAVLTAQEDIQSQVQEEIGDHQREIYLRRQLEAIKRELGEADESEEDDDLARRLLAIEFPEDVRKQVDRELAKLSRMARESMEAQVVRTYLETLADLPWQERSEDELDLAEAEAILEEDHYGLDDVKDRILEFLAVRQLRERREVGDDAASPPQEEENPTFAPAVPHASRPKRERKAPILLFLGPPGVGKTSLGRSIARALGREYVRISLGGVRDESHIRGHRRTYVGAMPGRIVDALRQAGTKNPVILLDEIDKLGASFQGDPAAALLEVLDPAQNDTFTDHYLDVPFDLSEVLFLATANFVQGIPAPLLDRMELVEFDGYTARQKMAIARRYLLPRQLRENGLDDGDLELADAALASVIARYTREAGVRQLERSLGQLARKVARRVASGEGGMRLDTDSVGELLGRPKVRPERAASEDLVGTVAGMYFTPAGGDILFVEASSMPGKGELVLTGQLGDVMRESARAAWTYARAHADTLAIEPEAFERDLHIHVPAGAVPKDGPSAGVAMATAIVSILARRPVRHDLAMTGEITLSGKVLPIGGVREKVLGAERAGISTVVLPRENEPDLEDLPLEVRQKMAIHAVDRLDEVLALALRGVEYHDGRLHFGGGVGNERGDDRIVEH